MRIQSDNHVRRTWQPVRGRLDADRLHQQIHPQAVAIAQLQVQRPGAI
jgi:hypothetical protein